MGTVSSQWVRFVRRGFMEEEGLDLGIQRGEVTGFSGDSLTEL